MNEITVTARALARPGKENELEAALRAVTVATHTEPGCLRYAVHRELGNPTSFLIVERWTSVASHDAHMKTAHVQELFQKIPSLVVSPPEVLRFELVPVGDTAKGSL